MRNPQIECEEFYNVMQAYRHAAITNQSTTVMAYEAVKAWIYKWYRQQPAQSKLPQGYLRIKYDTLHMLMRNLEEKNYGLAEATLDDLNLNGGE